MNQIVKAESPGEIMESVLIRGDLSKLTVEERGSYYTAVCTSVGLNPLTKPFEYITLNGKLRLYALKDCTDQLRSIHGISVTELAETEREGVFVVKAKVANAAGRTDVSTGAVSIMGLKGENLANALMKAETKAKRRATLSICGLGLLDETEVEDIPASQKAPVERPRVPSPSEVQPVVRQIEQAKPQERPPMQQTDPIVQQPEPEDGPHKIVGGTFASWADAYIAAVQSAADPSAVMAWVDANQQQLDKLAKGSPDNAQRVKAATAKYVEFLRKTAPQVEPAAQGEASDDMGGESASTVAKPPTGRRKPANKVPDIVKDYDGFISYAVDRLAKAEKPEDIEVIWDEVVDPVWSEITFPADKDALQGARRDAESRLEQ